MTRWLLVLGLVLSGGVALAQSDTATKDTTGTQNLKDTQRSSKLDTQENTREMGQAGETGQTGQSAIVPTGAKLVGTASAAEVREFPEMTKNKNVTTEDIVGARALDRVYETKKSYKQTVAHFDKMVRNGQADQIERTTTKTATAWSLKLPDGKVQNVVVRNTQPTTIETVQALGEVGQESLGTGGGQGTSAQPGTSGQPGTSDETGTSGQGSMKSKGTMPGTTTPGTTTPSTGGGNMQPGTSNTNPNPYNPSPSDNNQPK